MATHRRDREKHSSNVEKKNSNISRKSKQTSKKVVEKVMEPVDTSFIWTIIILTLAGIAGVAHNYHVSTLFENDRYFSHLSTLEREMVFRSEMGFYYSYYKTLVEAPTLKDGMHEILFNNLTEYPLVVNTLERFNLLPEVFLGTGYRMFNWLCNTLGIDGRKCYQVQRGEGQSPVYSCEGLQQPEYFYLESVWIAAGITAANLFIYGVFLSGSVGGGILAIISFFYNHGECTRVQWTPPLRESFAYPFCLLQMITVSVSLHLNKRTSDSTMPTIYHKLQVGMITTATSLCLNMWQFSQFLLTTQLIAILIMFGLNFISRFSALVIIIGQIFGVVQSLLLMYGNELLLTSLLTCLLLASVLTLLFVHPALSRGLAKAPVSIVVIACLTLFLKTRALTSNQDAHIINILKSKFTDYVDFDTLLYTCSPEFDFIGWKSIFKLTSTWLLPMGVVAVSVVALYWLYSEDKKKAIEPHIIYNILQLMAFGIMAVLVMRLKLFFTPHLCIVSSLLASRKFMKKLGSTEVHASLIVLIIAGMSLKGIPNILEQHSIVGEYSNVPLEETLIWIKNNTPKTAVFAGPMSLTSAILLSTRRPIVNHPHYEDALLREKTKKVYSAFSRKPPEEVFKLLSSLEVDYLIVAKHWCNPDDNPRIGCRMVDLWDVEDPANRGRPPTCPALARKNGYPFRIAFMNGEYLIFKLESPYVEIDGTKKY